MAKTPPQETDQKTDKMAAEAVRIATKLIDTWEHFSRTRLNDIQEKEENYFGKVRPRSSGRSNFPVPVLARYVDEIKSRLDESPSLKIDSRISMSRKLIARKADAVIKDLKKPQKGNWNKYDRNSRHLAIFAGYNAVDFFSETVDGDFGLVFDPIDHNEFIFEPGGGNDLEKHAGVGKFPLWRTKGEIEARAASGVYSPAQCRKLISRYGASDFRKNDVYFQSKNARYKSLGIDIDNNSYLGQPVYPLAQMQLTANLDGKSVKRYFLTFDYGSGIWVRFKELRKVFPSGLYSIDLWQTHEDQSNVMCKAPVDDIWPFAEGIRVKVNQLFDNHTQRVYGQTGYDPNFIPDPSQLPWRQASQLTKMRAYGGKPISQGIFQFKTEDMTSSTLDFVKWMDEFLTSVVGINPNDVSAEVQKVGILFGQLQKTSARLGIYNKSFKEMWERHGVRALWEMKEYLTEKVAIQIIGTRGVEWESFVGSELKDPADFDILAEGSNVELEMSQAKQKSQQESFDKILQDPDLKKEVNTRAAVEEILRIGQQSEEKIQQLMDTKNYGNEDMVARADLACEQIIKGKVPKLYPGADLSFVKYILDFANKLGENEHAKRIALLLYGKAHQKFVIRNMAQKAVGQLTQKGIPPNKVSTPLPPGMGPGQPSATPQPQPAPRLPLGPRRPSSPVIQRTRGRAPAHFGPKVKLAMPKARRPTPKPAIPTPSRKVPVRSPAPVV